MSLFLERFQVEVSNVPIDTTGAAANGDWYNLAKYGRIVFVIAQGAWAGGTPAVTLEQATSAAGGGGKALSFTTRYHKVALTGTVWVKAAVTSDTFNLPATANTMHAIEVDAAALDTNNDFQYARVVVASPGANADLIAIIAILGDAAYPDQVALLTDPKV